jgi:metal-responsive CopG/Arc/MetJ family transcriptional regulator
MATMNFSVPDDVKQEFNAAFAGENKSAVIASLMRQAVAERRRVSRRADVIEALFDLRRGQAPATTEEVTRARTAGRP